MICVQKWTWVRNEQFQHKLAQKFSLLAGLKQKSQDGIWGISNTMGQIGVSRLSFYFAFVPFVFLWECCSFSWDLKWTHLCSAGFAIISSIIDIWRVKIYELWPFSFLLLVMQLSEDRKKKETLPCIRSSACYKKLCLSSALCYKIDQENLLVGRKN